MNVFDTHQAEMTALAEQDLRFASIKVESKNIAEAAEILDKFQAGTLEPVEDLFGETVTPEQQAESARKQLDTAYERLQVAIAKI
jgi:predicted negative regulator of RcsB-dependent stress response